jgi:hypothetical protein
MKNLEMEQEILIGQPISEIPPPEAVKKFRRREIGGLRMPREGANSCRQNRR